MSQINSARDEDDSSDNESIDSSGDAASLHLHSRAKDRCFMAIIPVVVLGCLAFATIHAIGALVKKPVGESSENSLMLNLAAPQDLCDPNAIQNCYSKIKEPFAEGVLSGERTGQDPLKNSAIFIFHVNSSWKLSGSAPGSVATTTRCQNNGKWAKPMIVPIVASDLWRNDSTSISDARCNSTSGANANCSFAVNIPSSVNMTESVKVHSLQLAIRGRSVKSRLLVDKPEWILADSTAFTISGVGQLEIENILLRRLEIDDVHLDQCNRKEILDSCRDVVLGGRAGMAFVQSTVQGIRMLLKQDSVLRIQSSDVRQSSIEVTGSGLVSVSGAERHDVATSLFDNTDLVSAFLGRFSFSDVSFTTTVHPVNRPQANTDLLLPFSMNRQAVSPGKYFTRMSMCMHT